MKKNILIIFGITTLFLVISFQPAIATVETETEIDIEPNRGMFMIIS